MADVHAAQWETSATKGSSIPVKGAAVNACRIVYGHYVDNLFVWDLSNNEWKANMFPIGSTAIKINLEEGTAPSRMKITSEENGF